LKCDGGCQFFGTLLEEVIELMILCRIMFKNHIFNTLMLEFALDFFSDYAYSLLYSVEMISRF
jgi:hypothetical protein